MLERAIESACKRAAPSRRQTALFLPPSTAGMLKTVIAATRSLARSAPAPAPGSWAPLELQGVVVDRAGNPIGKADQTRQHDGRLM